MTLVSVLMPAYNHVRYVGQAVASVLAQTHTDLELLLVDDGSTDGTSDVVASFDDPRLRVLTHPGRANKGLHESVRLAQRHVRGEWLSFLASDDAWEPPRLERLLATGAHAAYSRAALMDESDTLTGVVWGAPADGDLFDHLLVTNVVPATTMLVDAATFDAVGGVSDERFEDLDFMLRVAARVDVAYVPEPLARYRVNTSGIAAQIAAEGRTLAEYASAVAHVAGWAGLPERRRATARTAADAWRVVLAATAGEQTGTVAKDTAAVAARIALAWGLDAPWPPAVARALRASESSRTRRRLRRLVRR